MAFIQSDIYSETLGTRCKLNAIIPLPFGGDPETRSNNALLTKRFSFYTASIRISMPGPAIRQSNDTLTKKALP
jgi:hypothetical protein